MQKIVMDGLVWEMDGITLTVSITYFISWVYVIKRLEFIESARLCIGKEDGDLTLMQEILYLFLDLLHYLTFQNNLLCGY